MFDSAINLCLFPHQSLLEEAQDSDDDWVYIPIRLKTGVERDRVLDAIVEQIRSIGDRLNRAFPL